MNLSDDFLFDNTIDDYIKDAFESPGFDMSLAFNDDDMAEMESLDTMNLCYSENDTFVNLTNLTSVQACNAQSDANDSYYDWKVSNNMICAKCRKTSLYDEFQHFDRQTLSEPMSTLMNHTVNQPLLSVDSYKSQWSRSDDLSEHDYDYVQFCDTHSNDGIHDDSVLSDASQRITSSSPSSSCSTESQLSACSSPIARGRGRPRKDSIEEGSQKIRNFRSEKKYLDKQAQEHAWRVIYHGICHRVTVSQDYAVALNTFTKLQGWKTQFVQRLMLTSCDKPRRGRKQKPSNDSASVQRSREYMRKYNAQRKPGIFVMFVKDVLSQLKAKHTTFSVFTDLMTEIRCNAPDLYANLTSGPMTKAR